ncbi:bifunctional methyltransferase/pyrophosphohydrolase YabN [Salinibacillus xinjiangensis]|uniref:Nucleoside triphosphate pyrophosphohydrolase n=1 Tax=Salinibacillus xinjiangensis TaxID=1229268 RepID=A0A6G1XAZ2_9BACI|nr:nucleoside triphosphate pyrophosphohydrolase [Salinibacillus xinjiangensis]MRG88181.1 nucleoside triphosphate pyrophosphohydrolase [Salinibacillus xinjiangensis]
MEKVITIFGLGAGDIDQISLGVYRTLTSSKAAIYTRTLDHPVIQSLMNEGVNFQSFDEVYGQHQDFESVYDQIAETLIQAAQQQSIIYTVPGHPMLAERTVQLLLEAEQRDANLKVHIGHGQSYLDSLFTALSIDPVEGFQFVDATSFQRFDLKYGQHIIFTQVYDEMIASEVKLTLMEDLPDDYEVTVVHAAGSDSEWMKKVPLYELDRKVPISNLISVYVPPVPKELRNHQFERLREVIAILRGPNGCPWDLEQTHESLRPFLIEEAYEVIEAINDQNDDKVAEELGDVLLQIMLHGQIGEEEGFYSVDDIIQSITDKMIRRHPHVFGNANLESSDAVIQSWEEIKQEEQGDQPSSVLDGIEKSLPALLTALELQKKAAKVGFDWKEKTPIMNKIKEEIKEFEEAIENQSVTNSEKEFGDLLFAIVNLGRHEKINPEIALGRTNQKFKSRFQYIEKRAAENKKSLKDMSLSEMDRYWEEAKTNIEKER